jgi:hypothetical protein
MSEIITLPPQLIAAHQAAQLALDRRKRLDAQVKQICAEIARREQELAHLHDELASTEVAAAVDEAEQSEVDALRVAVDTKASEFEGMRRRLAALENGASQIDEAVLAASTPFESQLQLFLRSLEVAFAAQLDEALAPARLVVRKLLALRSAGRAADFFAGTFVADANYMHRDMNLGRIGYRNLLDVDAPDEATVALLAPLLRTQAQLTLHKPYVVVAEIEAARRRAIPTDHGFVLRGGAQFAPDALR